MSDSRRSAWCSGRSARPSSCATSRSPPSAPESRELWLWEDCFLEGGPTAAAAALAWTERLRVGVGLLPVPLRNPALAAMEIATLARLFPAGSLPGLGHGVLDWMAQVGAAVASPMALLREYTVAVRDLLHGRTVDVDGRYVRLDGVALDWPPPEVPPLLVGARGPQTLRLAGEVADGVILDSGITPTAYGPRRSTVADGRVPPGRPGRARVVVYVEPTWSSTLRPRRRPRGTARPRARSGTPAPTPWSSSPPNVRPTRSRSSARSPPRAADGGGAGGRRRAVRARARRRRPARCRAGPDPSVPA